jgi:transcriptional regulator with GAF, ATPase, and Fis domain
VTTSTRERDVVQAFVELSNELVDNYDMADLLVRLTTNCARLLDIASAGLLLSDPRGTLHLVAASSERTHDLEAFQLQRDEGPCLDCYHSGEPVVVPDLEAEAHRWPQFVPAARSAGFASVHAVPMRLRSSVLGTLGLFGTHVGSLQDDDLALAQALVHVASVALVNERAAADRAIVNSQLQHALTSRILLEQAKGVIAQSGGLEIDKAFEVLRRYARDHGRKLSDVASEVVERKLHTGALLEHARAVGIVS